MLADHGIPDQSIDMDGVAVDMLARASQDRAAAEQTRQQEELRNESALREHMRQHDAEQRAPLAAEVCNLEEDKHGLQTTLAAVQQHEGDNVLFARAAPEVSAAPEQAAPVANSIRV